MGTLIYSILASLFFIEPILKVWFNDQTFNITYLYGCVGIILLCYQLFLSKIWKLSPIDIFLLILFLYNFSDILKYDYLHIVIFASIVYLSFQSLPDNSRTAYILICSGILQVLIMLMQWYKLLPSDNGFIITGSFDNPGPLGGYLAICFIACIGKYRIANKYLYILSCLLLGGALIISDSRAAWLGALLALLYMYTDYLRLNMFRKISVFIITTAVFIALSLTIYKTDSAKGRLAIWKISFEMIKEHPITGNGLMSFRRDYMHYQANYLNKHLDDEELILLSNNGFAFNEFIRIIYEQGVVGFTLIFIILVLIIREGFSHNSPYFPCLITLIIFSCFSYPSDIFLLFISTIMLIGLLSPNKPIIVMSNFSFYRKSAISLLCAFLIFVIGSQWIKKIRLENELNKFLYRNDINSLNYINQHYTDIKNSTDYLLRYARILYMKEEYQTAIPVMQQAILLYPTTDKICELGDIYQSMNQYEMAEQAYSQAIYLLPTRIYPHFCLFLLYKNTGQKNKAMRKAYDIINTPPKKINQHYQEIIIEVKRYIVDL